MGGLKRGPKSGTPEMQALMKAKRKEKNRIAMRARRAEKKRMGSAVTRAGYGNIPWGIVNQKRASLGGGAAKARGNVAEGLALCAMANSKKKQTRRREINDLVIPGSLPLTGIDWHEPIKEMSLSSAYGLEAVRQQPTRMNICNEPFYAEGTGIEKVALHFVPKNMQFPNDRLFNRAAASARALVVAVFGGDELISQRDRKYSAPEFHTVSMVDMTTPPTASKPVNKCISALYFTQLEGTRSMWIEWFGTDWGYRGKNFGIGTLLLQFILDLAIIDEGVDDVYLEVGQDKEGKMENWKAARHVYKKVGFVFMENIKIPGEVAGCCKHFGDDYYNVMC